MIGESLMLLVGTLAYPRWWMCADWQVFCNEHAPQKPFSIYEIISIIENNRNIMHIIQKGKAVNWAHLTGRRAFFLMQLCDTSHRIDVCCPAVRRSMLQAAKSWTDNRNNRNNTRNNHVYNSLLSAQYVAWLHKASLPSHPKALLALLDTYQSESWLGAAQDENWRPLAPET